jgi:hypothetical protein
MAALPASQAAGGLQQHLQQLVVCQMLQHRTAQALVLQGSQQLQKQQELCRSHLYIALLLLIKQPTPPPSAAAAAAAVQRSWDCLTAYKRRC